MYQLKFDKNIFRDLDKIPKKELIAIKKKFDFLKNYPRSSNAKKLKGYKNLYRIRQGNYRIIYEVQDKKVVVIIVAVKHRKYVYKDLK